MSNLIKLLDVFSEAKVVNEDSSCQLQHDELYEFHCDTVVCSQCILWFNSISTDNTYNLQITPILKELVNDYKSD